MCGIAGSNNSLQAFTLYRSNLDRGFYSSGSVVLDDLDMWVCEKTLGQFTEPSKPASVPGIHTNGVYHLYHSRGPTVETKEFFEENNHPFFYKDWIVAHNGIISNFEKLWKKYGDGDIYGKTDSCIIPRILSHTSTIGEALQELEGTFALWMYNITSRNLFITRSGSTLFADWITGDFSSTEFKNSSPLIEGDIYQIHYEERRIFRDSRIKKLYSYRTNSPYFIL